MKLHPLLYLRLALVAAFIAVGSVVLLLTLCLFFGIKTGWRETRETVRELWAELVINREGTS